MDYSLAESVGFDHVIELSELFDDAVAPEEPDRPGLLTELPFGTPLEGHIADDDDMFDIDDIVESKSRLNFPLLC